MSKGFRISLLVLAGVCAVLLCIEAASRGKTVAERLQEYGPKARQRLQPFFDRQKLTYPPAKLVLLGLKEEKRLEVYAVPKEGPMRFIRSYPILAASGELGPKLREGDQQVPEGIYAIESLNPNSRFHLSLRIGYPNAFDLKQAKFEGRTKPGSDIMIHGNAVSIGCLAMGDEAAEDLFVLAADTGIKSITVVLSPLDFRTGKEAPSTKDQPAWAKELYGEIRKQIKLLPAEAVPKHP